MAKVAGSTVRFYPNSGPVGTPVYSELVGETAFDISISGNNADTSSKDSAWETNLPVMRSYTMSGSGHYEPGDTGTDAIRDAIMAGTTLLFEGKTFNAETYAGSISFDDFSISTPYDGVVEFSYSGKGSGALTVT